MVGEVEHISTGVAALNTASGFKLSTIGAAMVGAAISLRFSDDLGWSKRLTGVLSATALGGYLAHPVCDYFKVPSYSDAAAVLIGLFGLSLTAAFFRELKKLEIAAIIKARFGGNGKSTSPEGD